MWILCRTTRNKKSGIQELETLHDTTTRNNLDTQSALETRLAQQIETYQALVDSSALVEQQRSELATRYEANSNALTELQQQSQSQLQGLQQQYNQLHTVKKEEEAHAARHSELIQKSLINCSEVFMRIKNLETQSKRLRDQGHINESDMVNRLAAFIHTKIQ